MFCLIVHPVCLCSVMLLNGFILLTCFHHNHLLSHSTHILMSLLWLSYLMGKILLLSCQEVTTWSCVPLNQCDMESCSDGISMVIATTLFMYQMDYNKLWFSHPTQMIMYCLNFVIICGLGYMFVCICYSPRTVLSTFHVFHSVFSDIFLWPSCLVTISYMFIK